VTDAYDDIGDDVDDDDDDDEQEESPSSIPFVLDDIDDALFERFRISSVCFKQYALNFECVDVASLDAIC
jgi:hypothetical protein